MIHHHVLLRAESCLVEIGRALRRHVSASRADDGCLRFDLFQGDGEFLLIETWRDRLALEAHRRMPHYAEYARDVRPFVQRRELPSEGGKRVVFTNGCFDLLHPGHIHTLKWAKAQGDVLIVGVNSDASMARIKRPPRLALRHRMQMLEALACVDSVIPFSEDTPEALIASLKPDVLVKGYDAIPPIPGAHLVKEVLFAPPCDFAFHASDL